MTRPTLFLAAGFGTRMRPLTDNMPKPLIKVGGKTLLDHALDLGRAANAGPLVVNAHYLSDQIKDHLEGSEISVAVETPDILDSGGAIKGALDLLGESPVFTMNTDAVWAGPNPFEILNSQWDPKRMDCLLLVGPPDHCIGHSGPGDFSLGPLGKLTRGGDATFLGLQIVKTEPFRAHPMDIFGMWDIWAEALSKGRMFGTIYPGQWCDVGQPQSIPLAEKLLELGNV